MSAPVNRPAPRVPAGPNSLAGVASRRALLGAIAAAPLLALPIDPALASTREWDAALAAHHEAEDVLRNACSIYNDAQEGYFADCPKHNPYEGAAFYPGDTAESFNARIAKERADRESADLACRRRHRVDETEAVMNEACSASCRAIEALLDTPAPNMQAAILKLEIAADQGEGFDLVLADLRRLSGSADV